MFNTTDSDRDNRFNAIGEKFMVVKDVLDIGQEAERIQKEVAKLNARLDVLRKQAGQMTDDVNDFTSLVNVEKLDDKHPFAILSKEVRRYFNQLVRNER